MKLPVQVNGSRAAHLVLKDVVLLDDCPHILVSLGRLAEENGIGTWVAPNKEKSYLAWRDQRTNSLHTVHMLNVGVLVIPLMDAGGSTLTSPEAHESPSRSPATSSTSATSTATPTYSHDYHSAPTTCPMGGRAPYVPRAPTHAMIASAPPSTRSHRPIMRPRSALMATSSRTTSGRWALATSTAGSER